MYPVYSKEWYNLEYWLVLLYYAKELTVQTN